MARVPGSDCVRRTAGALPRSGRSPLPIERVATDHESSRASPRRAGGPCSVGRAPARQDLAPDPRRGYHAESYFLPHTGYPKFEAKRGWYEVDDETARWSLIALCRMLDR